MTSDFEKKVDGLRQVIENLQFQYNRALRLRVAEEAEFAKEVDSAEVQDLDVVRSALELRRLQDDEKLILLEKITVLEEFFKEQIESFREGIAWKEKAELIEGYEFIGSKERQVVEIVSKVDNLLMTHTEKLRELLGRDKKEYEAYKEGLIETLRDTLGKLPAVTFYFKTRMQYLEKSFEEVPEQQKTIEKKSPPEHETKEPEKKLIIKGSTPEIGEVIAEVMPKIDGEFQELKVLNTTPKKFKKKDVKEYFGETQFGGQSIKAFKLLMKCPACSQKQTITDIHNRCWNCNNFIHLKPVDTKEDRENEHYRTG